MKSFLQKMSQGRSATAISHSAINESFEKIWELNNGVNEKMWFYNDEQTNAGVGLPRLRRELSHLLKPVTKIHNTSNRRQLHLSYYINAVTDITKCHELENLMSSTNNASVRRVSTTLLWRELAKQFEGKSNTQRDKLNCCEHNKAWMTKTNVIIMHYAL